jgi:hypothetical protein
MYQRAVILDIYDVSKFKPGDNIPAKAQVYNAKLTSEGPCGTMGILMDPLLEAMFQDFPASGSGRKLTIKGGITRC